MTKNIITISREFGSGGRTVGRLLGEKLGIPCYDKEFIKKIADETGFAPEFVEKNGRGRAEQIHLRLPARSLSGPGPRAQRHEHLRLPLRDSENRLSSIWRRRGRA